MIGNFIERVIANAPKAVKSWADSEEYEDGVILYPSDGGAPVELNGRAVMDGIESFAAFNLKHEDAKFRDTARKIQREQWGGIKLNRKITSSIVQHGVFGEEIF